ncbi:hypothetical protein PHJA_002346400 [Phtheirospermum japonicum]|uniref:Uncharacterized protein n=1 Tax=Phtheirospermum japonicum TaxID=374723 RepID=A0A830D0S3_9LAMI|nr:hypothetical protein PHJA_002346400 [Phtheirospermum japonicum]
MLNDHQWLDAHLNTSSPLALVLFFYWHPIGGLLVAPHAQIGKVQVGYHVASFDAARWSWNLPLRRPFT